jgi:hypothetical protein
MYNLLIAALMTMAVLVLAHRYLINRYLVTRRQSLAAVPRQIPQTSSPCHPSRGAYGVA